SALAPGQVVAQARLRLEPRPAAEVKARVAELLGARKSTQPTTKRTFGSVFKNPPGDRGAGRLIEAGGLKGHPTPAAIAPPPAPPGDLQRGRGRRGLGRAARGEGGGAAAGARAIRDRARARGALRRPARAAAVVGNRAVPAKPASWPTTPGCVLLRTGSAPNG